MTTSAVSRSRSSATTRAIPTPSTGGPPMSIASRRPQPSPPTPACRQRLCLTAAPEPRVARPPRGSILAEQRDEWVTADKRYLPHAINRLLGGGPNPTLGD